MTSSPPPSPWRAASVNLALALGTTLIVGGGVELVARRMEGRVAPPSPEARQTTTSPGNAGFYVMSSTSPGWPPWTEFNRDGLRDRPHPLQKPAGVYRIAILGDSVTVGPDGHPDQAYPQVLQALLSERSPWPEVMNVALWGWATREEATAWDRLARPYRPDLVVLAVCLNDLIDLQGEARKPPALLLALHQRSALVRLLVGARRRELSRVEELFEQPDEPRVRARLDLLYGEIRDLKRRVEADGSRFAVLLFPYRAQVTNTAPPPSVQVKLGSFCASESIPFLDLLPSLTPTGEAAFLPGDGIHLSPEGCQTTAQALAQWSALPDSVRRTEALDSVVGRDGADATPAGQLLALVAHENPAVRAEAVWAMGRREARTAGAVAMIVRSLGDGDERVRRAAVLALASSGHALNEDATGALLRALSDSAQGVRWEAARTLASRGVGPAHAEALAEALGGPDSFVRGFVAWYLGEMGPAARSALPALVVAQNDPDPGVRALVLRSLAVVGAGAPEAIEALRKALREGTGDDRWKAARSIGKLGPAGRVAIPDLVTALRDENGHVQRHAALALGRLGPAEGVRSALEQAALDPDPAVAAAASEALRALAAAPGRRP